jgi:hypothetical protein
MEIQLAFVSNPVNEENNGFINRKVQDSKKQTRFDLC